jgi:hypothetical protein
MILIGNFKIMTSENDNSLSKQEAIKQLRKTIEQLETIIHQLDDTSVIDLPNSTAIENLLKTTTELVRIIPLKSTSQESVVSNVAETDAVETKKEEIKSDSLSNLETITVESEPKKIKIKAVESVPGTEKKQAVAIKETSLVNKPKKSNNKGIIFGAIAAIIITLIPLSWKLFLADKIPQLIVQEKTIIIQPDADTVIIPRVPSIETEPVFYDSPVSKNLPDQLENKAEPATEITKKIPSELIAENRPQKLTVDTVKPTITLTPEQNLIAALEAKTNNLATRYSEDLVISIKPNFTDSIVMVTLANDWYQLLANRQDKIMEEMLRQSSQLEFNKLKIIDLQNNLIARSPIVGKDMVILRRTM